MNPLTTVVIRTVGRPTLLHAAWSAHREGFPILIVSDGVEIQRSLLPPHRYCQLGRSFGYYGVVAQNVGAYLATTPFVTFLDDDDELVEGAGAFITRRLRERPRVDIWVPGIRYADGGEACLSGNAEDPQIGEVAVPTYRTEIFAHIPFTHSLNRDDPDTVDRSHVWQCVRAGYRVDWFGKVLYSIRPRLEGFYGRGL